MNRNRRRSKNEIRCGSMAGFLFLALYAGVAALAFVGLKHQLHAKGSEKKQLEHQLETLKTENYEASAQFAQLTSRATLQRQLAMGSIELTPIPDAAIVRVDPTATPIHQTIEEIVPVVHQVAGN